MADQPQTGEPLVRLHEDNEDDFRDNLAAYESETLPIREQMRQLMPHKLREVDASDSTETTRAYIDKAMYLDQM